MTDVTFYKANQTRNSEVERFGIDTAKTVAVAFAVADYLEEFTDRHENLAAEIDAYEPHHNAREQECSELLSHARALAILMRTIRSCCGHE